MLMTYLLSSISIVKKNEARRILPFYWCLLLLSAVRVNMWLTHSA